MIDDDELIYDFNSRSKDALFFDFFSGTFYAMRTQFKK